MKSHDEVYGTWVAGLNEEQGNRYGQLLDSRVRLLGETYSQAVKALREPSEENRLWVLEGKS